MVKAGWTEVEQAMDDYVRARDAAGSPEGIAFNEQLAAMTPEEAWAKIRHMFALVAPEDLVTEICCDLRLDRELAVRIVTAGLATSRRAKEAERGGNTSWQDDDGALSRWVNGHYAVVSPIDDWDGKLIGWHWCVSPPSSEDVESEDPVETQEQAIDAADAILSKMIGEVK